MFSHSSLLNASLVFATLILAFSIFDSLYFHRLTISAILLGLGGRVLNKLRSLHESIDLSAHAARIAPTLMTGGLAMAILHLLLAPVSNASRIFSRES